MLRQVTASLRLSSRFCLVSLATLSFFLTIAVNNAIERCFLFLFPSSRLLSFSGKMKMELKDFFAATAVPTESQRYRITEIIGKGSYGVVASAVDQFSNGRHLSGRSLFIDHFFFKVKTFAKNKKYCGCLCR